MARTWLKRVMVNIIIIATMGNAAPAAEPAFASKISDLNQRISQIYNAGKYKEATPVAEKVLGAAEKALGPDHPNTLLSVYNLGNLYGAQGRYTEAEPLLKRALTGYERLSGPEHADTLRAVGSLGKLYQDQRR